MRIAAMPLLLLTSASLSAQTVASASRPPQAPTHPVLNYPTIPQFPLSACPSAEQPVIRNIPLSQSYEHYLHNLPLSQNSHRALRNAGTGDAEIPKLSPTHPQIWINKQIPVLRSG